MSTKWNNSQKLQKTPKVCKKGPADLPENLRQFRYYPLQAYASWDDRSGTQFHIISGIAQLQPSPISLEHVGWIQGDPNALRLILQWNPVDEVFVYTVELYFLSSLQRSVSVTFSDPRPALPWIAGLYTWHDYDTNEHVESKIYS